MRRRLAFEQRHAAGPARRGGFDLDGEAAHFETEWRQLVEVGQLFHMAITDVAAGLVAFPDDARVAGLEKPLMREREWRVPAPAVDAGDADALLEQKKRCLAAHAAARVEVPGLAIGRRRRGVDETMSSGFSA